MWWTVSVVALLSGQSSSSGRRRPATTSTVRPVVEEDETAEQLESECPQPNGFFADANQCDKYYACTDNKITEKLCPDGMVFNDYSSEQEKCDLPLNIDCSQRPALREYIFIYFILDYNSILKHMKDRNMRFNFWNFG